LVVDEIWRLFCVCMGEDEWALEVEAFDEVVYIYA